jgi:SAM-dependent methyltransferase
MSKSDEQPPSIPTADVGSAQPGASSHRDKTLEWDLRATPAREVAVGELAPTPRSSATMRAVLDGPVPDDRNESSSVRNVEHEIEVEVSVVTDEKLPTIPQTAPPAPRVDLASQLGAAPESPEPMKETPTAPLSIASGIITAPPPGAPATRESSGEIEIIGDVEVQDVAEAESRVSAPPPPPVVTPPPIRQAVAAPPPPTVPPVPVAAKVAAVPPPPFAAKVPPIPAAALDHAVGADGNWSEPLKERPRRKRAKPWFEEVFDEDYLRTLPFMTAEQTLRETNFVHKCLELSEGQSALDVGCGYGRHAIEMAQRGVQVTGLDLSLPLLIRAADESQRRGLPVNFVHADMREMNFDAQFDGAYCMMTTFGYFDEETNQKVAAGIFKSLRPGGKFLLETLNRDYIVGDLPTRVWWEGDGCVVLEEVDFHFHTSRLGLRRSIVFQDGRQFEHDISIRCYTLHEIGRLLKQAGFRVTEVSGGLATRGRFFGSTSRSIIVLCERPVE